MPLYEFTCDACGQRFEVIQKFSDDPPEVCKRCGKGPIHKLVSSPAFQFKGTGWYVTDYAQKAKPDASSTAPAKGGDGTKAEGASSTTGSSAKSDAAGSSTDKPSAGSAAKDSKE